MISKPAFVALLLLLVAPLFATTETATAAEPAAVQNNPFLGRFTGDERVARRTRRVAFVIRENGEAIVRANYPNQRETDVDNARWAFVRGTGEIEIRTTDRDVFRLQTAGRDQLRVRRLDRRTGREISNFVVDKLDIDPFVGRYSGEERGFRGTREVTISIQRDEDAIVRTNASGRRDETTERGRVEAAGQSDRVRLLMENGDEYLLERISRDTLRATRTESGSGRTDRPFTVTRGEAGGGARVAEGILTWGRNAQTLRICGTREVLWVDGDQNMLRDIERQYERVSNRPFQRVFVRFRGEQRSRPGRGVGADYDGIFYVNSVELIRAWQRGDCSGAGAKESTLRGVVTYRVRMAIPQNATVEVELVQTGRWSREQVIASDTIRPRRQVPIPFELRFDPDDISQRARYVVRASITVAGRKMFETRQDVQVSPLNPPRSLEVVVEPMGGIPDLPDNTVPGRDIRLEQNGTGYYQIGNRGRESVDRATVLARTNGEAEITLNPQRGPGLSLGGRIERITGNSIRIRLTNSRQADASGMVDVSYDQRGTIISIRITNGRLDGQRLVANFGR